jgi:tetratricopeptide (TPR) repeat protein
VRLRWEGDRGPAGRRTARTPRNSRTRRSATASPASTRSRSNSAIGRRPQAVDVLQGALRTLPPEERSETDHFRLLLGLIAGAERRGGAAGALRAAGIGERPRPPAGRPAAPGAPSSPPAPFGRARRAARQADLRAEAPPDPGEPPALPGPAGARRGAARGSTSRPPLYARAEDDAHALLEKFPGSPLKAQAYAVLAGSAWEQQRYRTAADYAFKAGGELPPGPIRAEFGVLVAEAWFRAGVQGRDAGDFRSAADAYAAALRSRPEGVRPGSSCSSRCSPRSRPAPSGRRSPRLDELARDPGVRSRRPLGGRVEPRQQPRGARETAEAYDRVNRLLRGMPPPGRAPGPPGEDGLAPGAPLLRRGSPRRR